MGRDGFNVSRDKTCQLTHLNDHVMYHYHGLIKLTFVK